MGDGFVAGRRRPPRAAGFDGRLRRPEKEARGRRAQYTGFDWFGATILALEENLFRMKD